MSGRVLTSLREAIYWTVARSHLSMKALASELGWSPSQLSMATALGDENSRAFPADDPHLIRLQMIAADHFVLYTMANLLGYGVYPKPEAVPKLLLEVCEELNRLSPKVQKLLEAQGIREGK